jgi:beta-glucanase (GH16 family)
VSRHGPLLWADEFDGPAGARLADGFHAYAVHWEPDRIRWFAVGGTASVAPDRSTSFPQTMLVDYVRVHAA